MSIFLLLILYLINKSLTLYYRIN